MPAADGLPESWGERTRSLVCQRVALRQLHVANLV